MHNIVDAQVAKHAELVKQTDKPNDISVDKPASNQPDKHIGNQIDKDFNKHSINELNKSNNKSVDKSFEKSLENEINKQMTNNSNKLGNAKHAADAAQPAVDANKANHKVPGLDIRRDDNNHIKTPVFEEDKVKSSRNDERAQRYAIVCAV